MLANLFTTYRFVVKRASVLGALAGPIGALCVAHAGNRLVNSVASAGLPKTEKNVG